MATYSERKARSSELLQLILLDDLYAQSRSERIIFQGGTALRWIYGGVRFSEDLDFVTDLPGKELERVLVGTFQRTARSAVAQFGPGHSEVKSTGKRKGALKLFCIYRPDKKRERIAVKLEFESLRPGHQPAFEKFVLRNLPLVAGLVTAGDLIIPYSSSIILAETPEEILSDKIRALYERTYLKGRDIYDIWWLTRQLKVAPELAKVRQKLAMYQADFVPTREADCFQKKETGLSVAEALKRDLPRFLPQNILSMYEKDNFAVFHATLKEVTADLLDQGLTKLLKDHESRKRNP